MEEVREPSPAPTSAARCSPAAREDGASSDGVVPNFLEERQVIVLALGMLVGCGPNCQSTCGHLFDGSSCGIERPGVEPSEQTRRCINQCEDALNQPGKLDGFNPNEPTSSQDVTLENEQQAAAWMDCVWETAPDASDEQCRALEREGYCAPTAF